jgi:GDP-L-fucose synthase
MRKGEQYQYILLTVSNDMDKDAKIYVAGHNGLVGSAIVRRLQSEGYTNIICKSHSALDLTDQVSVADFFERERPEYVFLAAARVGGILANNIFPADFIRDNIMIQTNVIDAAYQFSAGRLLFLGSSCIYPKLARQPIKESYLMTGPLESTNSAYAIAKIAGVEMCWSYNRQHGTQFIPVMPTNLYGAGDNFDLETSHVLPAMIRKFHLAKLIMEGDLAAVAKDEKCFGPIPDDIKAGLQNHGNASDDHMNREKSPLVMLWGTGKPMREFLHVNDLASACVFLMQLGTATLKLSDNPSLLINIGVGHDLTVKDLAEMVKEIIGYKGQVSFDPSKPDGTPRKLLDVARINSLGWQAEIDLEDGIRETYSWYLDKLS